MNNQIRFSISFIRVLIVLIFITVSQSIFAQQPFVLSGLLEPDYRQSYLEHSGGDIIFLSKKNGHQTSKISEYELMAFDDSLNSKWTYQLELNKNENFVKLFELKGEIVLMAIDHNTELQYSNLLTWGFDKNGKLLKADTLLKNKVESWVDYPGKGAVKQDFNRAICAIQNTSFVTPLEYKYDFAISPDSSKLLIYHYDYSQEGLKIDVNVYDQELNLLSQGVMPVDKNYTSYGMAVNDLGEVFLYKANDLGGVVVVKYNIETHAFIYLKVYSANSSRENLKIKIISNDIICIGKLNKKNRQFVGVTYSVLDFAKEEVIQTRFHPVSVEYKREIMASQKEADRSTIEKYWEDYDLVDFFVSDSGQVTFFVEKREIISEDYHYDDTFVESLENWVPRSGQVRTGTLLIFSFDKNYDLLWRDYIVKNQETGVIDGVNSCSFIVDERSDSVFHILFAEAKGQGVLLNELHYYTIERFTGEILGNKVLENEMKLTLSRPYSFFRYDNGKLDFIFVGRKGLLGTKAFINRIKL